MDRAHEAILQLPVEVFWPDGGVHCRQAVLGHESRASWIFLLAALAWSRVVIVILRASSVRIQPSLPQGLLEVQKVDLSNLAVRDCLHALLDWCQNSCLQVSLGGNLRLLLFLLFLLLLRLEVGRRQALERLRLEMEGLLVGARPGVLSYSAERISCRMWILQLLGTSSAKVRSSSVQVAAGAWAYWLPSTESASL